MSEHTKNLPIPKEGQRRLFLKAGCPFCTKLVVFIAAAGIIDKVELEGGRTLGITADWDTEA